jgi:hypothetical protein
MEQKKLRTHQQAEHEHEVHAGQQQAVREFESVEDLLRDDAAKVAVPETVSARVRDSVAKEPPEQPGFWKRLFGR